MMTDSAGEVMESRRRRRASGRRAPRSFSLFTLVIAFSSFPFHSRRGFGALAFAGGRGFGAPRTPPPSSRPPREGERPQEKGGEGASGSLGTLFRLGDEEIREVSSDEYLEYMREWSPLLRFAVEQGGDAAEFSREAERMAHVLAGMIKWKPVRTRPSAGLQPSFSFGVPVGAFKGGELDAIACIQIDDRGGNSSATVEWIMENPKSLGLPQGNASDWLLSGIRAILAKKLDMKVTVRQGASGDENADLNSNSSPP